MSVLVLKDTSIERVVYQVLTLPELLPWFICAWNTHCYAIIPACMFRQTFQQGKTTCCNYLPPPSATTVLLCCAHISPFYPDVSSSLCLHILAVVSSAFHVAFLLLHLSSSNLASPVLCLSMYEDCLCVIKWLVLVIAASNTCVFLFVTFVYPYFPAAAISLCLYLVSAALVCTLYSLRHILFFAHVFIPFLSFCSCIYPSTVVHFTCVSLSTAAHLHVCISPTVAIIYTCISHTVALCLQ